MGTRMRRCTARASSGEEGALSAGWSTATTCRHVGQLGVVWNQMRKHFAWKRWPQAGVRKASPLTNGAKQMPHSSLKVALPSPAQDGASYRTIGTNLISIPGFTLCTSLLSSSCASGAKLVR